MRHTPLQRNSNNTPTSIIAHDLNAYIVCATNMQPCGISGKPIIKWVLFCKVIKVYFLLHIQLMTSVLGIHGTCAIRGLSWFILIEFGILSPIDTIHANINRCKVTVVRCVIVKSLHSGSADDLFHCLSYGGIRDSRCITIEVSVVAITMNRKLFNVAG